MAYVTEIDYLLIEMVTPRGEIVHKWTNTKYSNSS